ncbi:MAG TPA: adenylyltransferase/cytidyltransferase family protein [Armatimonadota bacterium]|jgi:D-beta-D-heptose 7-phosphate kinase/D-beta-D-heptose 1-phosphate adenosyltransferase
MPVLCKLHTLEEAVAAVAQMREDQRRVVMTNGCFDLLHPGHIVHLQQARDLGDALIVAINSDRSVRKLKGPGRPVYEEMQRALALSALECVDVVTVFDEVSPLEIMQLLAPDVYVKGGDYTLETLNQEERHVLESAGCEIHILPQVENFSTTNLIRRVQFRE